MMAMTQRVMLSVKLTVCLLLCVALVGPSLRSSPVAASTALVQIVPNASTMGNLAYDPDVIKVVIGVNNSVVWRNNDNTVHTATGTNFTGFNTGNISPGASASYTFNTPGTYPYHCLYHIDMYGTVVVKAASASTASTTSSSGGGIPEFPYQLLAVTVFTFLLVVSYLTIRRSRQR